MDGATREIFWQIGPRWLLYVAFVAAMCIFAAGLWKNVRWIRQGAPIQGTINLGHGFLRMLGDLFSHRSIRKERLAGTAHLLIFYPFMILFLVTLYVMVSEYLLPGIFSGMPYVLLNLGADLAGICMLAGVAIALVRRLAVRREGQPGYVKSTAGDMAILVLIGFLALSGLFLEGLRIHLQHDPWRAFTPGGWAASALCTWIGRDEGISIFRALWWIHALAAFGFIAWLPFSNLLHILATPANLATNRDGDPAGRLPRTDLRGVRAGTISAQDMGMGSFTSGDVTWKQRLELLSCMRCGRCQTLCPAFLSGQPLSPFRVTEDLKGYVFNDRGPYLRNVQPPHRDLVEAVSAEALWACRLCRACEEQCPAGIRHVLQIMGLRRGEVLGHGRMPVDAAQALRGLARTGNPYNASPAERERWMQEHKVPTSARTSGKKEALLLWTGCLNQGDDAKARVLSALVRLLKSLHIDFVALDGHESCCGEPARNLGDEDLFQSLARRQIQRIEAMGTDKVLVHCPHCYTVLKDEYPSLGASFEVIHSSQFIWDILGQGRVNLEPASVRKKVAFHDPCFLGRYQGLYDPPRRILQMIPGTELVEAERSRERSLCCGAGGGHFFMDLDTGERPALKRLQEMLDLKPDVLCVSCTFCLNMFEDAMRLLPDPQPVQIADWLELLAVAANVSR